MSMGLLSKSIRKQVEQYCEAFPGTVVSRTTKGHTLIKAPNGETMLISRNSGSGHKKSSRVEADFRRCFGEC